MKNDKLKILGARENNLRNVDIDLPRNELVVFTGLSGSGKSSLAFNTIYAEGQRRYMDTMSAYARRFVGGLSRPDVDVVEGLSPVISIEQKTTNNNPRSTVGTVTEIYDFVRLLYARVAEAYSYLSGKKMMRYSEAEVLEKIQQRYEGHDIVVLAPLVKRRKGHYRELFTQVAKRGFLRVRVDGELRELSYNMQVDRYKTHDIELVIDRMSVNKNHESNRRRLGEAVKTAFKQGKGVLMVLDNSDRSIGHYSRMLMDPDTGLSYAEPEPNTFSFNSPYGACPKCNGLGEIAEVDLLKLVPNPNLSISDGAFAVLGSYNSESYIYRKLEQLGQTYGFTVNDPVASFTEEARDAILYGTSDYMDTGTIGGAGTGFPGIVNYIRQMAENDGPASLQKWAASFMNTSVCPECHGHRLKTESLHYYLLDKNIGDLCNMNLTEFYEWMMQLEDQLEGGRREIAHEIIREIVTRTKFMLDVGLGYLSLNRSARTLSGGESQRIRLATQIGSRLVNVLYILDEPSIGLHQRDNRKLIDALKELRDIGNSVIVVEHDRDMINSGDYVVDIGPGAGVHGGRVVFAGTHDEMMKAAKDKDSLTLRYIKRELDIAVPQRRPIDDCQYLTLIGATGNNLKDVTLSIPLRRFVCITGVSGSGKSSLVNETLMPILSRHFYRSLRKPLPYKDIVGIDNIDKVIEIDQSPIGRTPRSNPATYVGVFDDIRRLFAELPASRIRGYKPGRFSFNVSEGRCDTCKGAGLRTIEMNFLPDVYVNCEVCNGKRYNRETLEIRYRGKSISDVLDMTIEEATEFFDPYPKIARKLRAIRDVGLGYITLGQSSTTLSGGEAQRIKLAAELGKSDTGSTLYLLDEPTTGLHFEDIRVLLQILQKLVDKGNSVLVIEHNMDVIKVADYIIDLGPEGGSKGGNIVFAGSPEKLIKQKNNYTAQYLREELAATKK
ncbi:MAG: excinuclease ABC subunit UvrA [Bacteroidales bacterium]|nr:excinuclease ABC subunit UvrA [Bacteroidales bacterium]